MSVTARHSVHLTFKTGTNFIPDSCILPSAVVGTCTSPWREGVRGVGYTKAAFDDWQHLSSLWTHTGCTCSPGVGGRDGREPAGWANSAHLALVSPDASSICLPRQAALFSHNECATLCDVITRHSHIVLHVTPSIERRHRIARLYGADRAARNLLVNDVMPAISCGLTFSQRQHLRHFLST